MRPESNSAKLYIIRVQTPIRNDFERIDKVWSTNRGIPELSCKFVIVVVAALKLSADGCGD